MKRTVMTYGLGLGLDWVSLPVGAQVLGVFSAFNTLNLSVLVNIGPNERFESHKFLTVIAGADVTEDVVRFVGMGTVERPYGNEVRYVFEVK